MPKIFKRAFCILNICLLNICLAFTSCATREPSDTDAITMALELSGIYVKNQDFDNALAVIDRALLLSDDTRLYQNKILILKETERYEEALDVSIDAYRKNPYIESMLRNAIELATILDREETIKGLYEHMFSINAITADDLVFIIKEAKERGDNNSVEFLINYGLRWQLYNKEFFDLAYEATGNEDYRIAAKYIK